MANIWPVAKRDTSTRFGHVVYRKYTWPDQHLRPCARGPNPLLFHCLAKSAEPHNPRSRPYLFAAKSRKRLCTWAMVRTQRSGNLSVRPPQRKARGEKYMAGPSCCHTYASPATTTVKKHAHHSLGQFERKRPNAAQQLKRHRRRPKQACTRRASKNICYRHRVSRGNNCGSSNNTLAQHCMIIANVPPNPRSFIFSRRRINHAIFRRKQRHTLLSVVGSLRLRSGEPERGAETSAQQRFVKRVMDMTLPLRAFSFTTA